MVAGGPEPHLKAGGAAGLGCLAGPIATEPNYSGGEGGKEALVNLVQLTSQGLAEPSQEALRFDAHSTGTATAVLAGSARARRTR